LVLLIFKLAVPILIDKNPKKKGHKKGNKTRAKGRGQNDNI